MTSIFGQEPRLSLRKGDALALYLKLLPLLHAANMNKYYSLLKTTLEEKGILNSQSIGYFIMDESGVHLDHKLKPPRVQFPMRVESRCILIVCLS